MLWAMGYVTWKYRHKPASNSRASIQPLLSYVLCSPAMSASVELVFSQSGLLMRPNRARMSNSLLETLVFLKCNSSLGVWCCSMQHMTGLCCRIEHWWTVLNYSTDKICIQNLLLYTEHVFWFQLFVIDLIFWHITFTTDLCGASKICNW